MQERLADSSKNIFLRFSQYDLYQDMEKRLDLAKIILHGIRYGRKLLALDMVEEFRQPVVDRFVIHCFNRRIINEYDFEIEEGRVLLNEDGFRKFCTEYEKWMCKASITGKSFCQIIRKQVAELKNAIQYGNAYLPFNWGERCETRNKL